MTGDPWQDDPEFRGFAREVRAELVPKLEQSGAVVSLVPEGEPDVKYAVELGMSIMLDKPIIAVVRPGTRLPERLVRVADRIVEAELDTDEGTRAAHERIRAVLVELLPDDA